MGFYTHVETDMTLRADAPTEVVDLLLWMAGVSPAHWDEKLIEPRYPGPLPDADLFRTERWSLMLTCSYAGHSATRSWDPVTRRLRTSSSFKNYGNEIEKFSRWVLPYLQERTEPFLSAENEDHWVWRAWTSGLYNTFLHDYYGDEGGDRHLSTGSLK